MGAEEPYGGLRWANPFPASSPTDRLGVCVEEVPFSGSVPCYNPTNSSENNFSSWIMNETSISFPFKFAY